MLEKMVPANLCFGIDVSRDQPTDLLDFRMDLTLVLTPQAPKVPIHPFRERQSLIKGIALGEFQDSSSPGRQLAYG